MIRVQFLLMILTIMGLSTAGCSADAIMLRDTPTGGTVSYPFESESDILTATERQAALRLISNKCPHGSRIVKEGEISKVSKKADRFWRGQITNDRLWAIEFVCT